MEANVRVSELARKVRKLYPDYTLPHVSSQSGYQRWFWWRLSRQKHGSSDIHVNLHWNQFFIMSLISQNKYRDWMQQLMHLVYNTLKSNIPTL